MEIWLATFNLNKAKEIEYLLSEAFSSISLSTANKISGYSPPPETGASFKENALIKARSLSSVKKQVWVIAEDSGLEVTGLGNLPGIHSARYAGPNASDSENNAKLLKMLQIRKVSDRSARFVCHLVAISPIDQIFHFEGVLEGSIAPLPKGIMGFGYDPLFIPKGQTQTLAELGPSFKNQFSHRSQAIKQWINHLKEQV